MEQFAFAYWWLIFPVMWMLSGIVGMWFAHRRQQGALELMKTCAAQGRNPSELAKVLDAPSACDGRWDRRWERRAWRHTPFWAWRRAVMAVCAAVGFWLAAEYWDSPLGWDLTPVAIIMSVLAVGAVMTAIASSLFAPRAPQI